MILSRFRRSEALALAHVGDVLGRKAAHRPARLGVSTLLAAMQDTRRRLFLVKLRNALMLAVIALGVIAYVAICFVAMLRWAVG